MSQRLVCTIPSSSNSYEIEIGRGLLSHLSAGELSLLASRFAIITDDRMAPLHGEQLCKYLSSVGLEVYLFMFPGGEQHKTRATKEMVENQLFEKGLGRDTCVIALGGGIATDLAGYVAATYCRGIPWVIVPTSLMGMIDASIGGKTGVNVPYGKNLIGCLYQPKKIFIDPALLQTLPSHELVNGIVEIIKYGLITDKQLFHTLEHYAAQLLELDPTILDHVIVEGCRIKKEIIEQDEKENGKRYLLNFGHTVGHALEKLSGYSLSHGEAVAIGILVESRLAVQLGNLSSDSFDAILQMMRKYAVPLKLPQRFPLDTLLEAMALDKKSVRGRPRFVIIDGIGSSLPFEGRYCTHVEESLIKQALQWMNDALCVY